MRTLLVWLRIIAPKLIFVGADNVDVAALQSKLGHGYYVVPVATCGAPVAVHESVLKF